MRRVARQRRVHLSTQPGHRHQQGGGRSIWPSRAGVRQQLGDRSTASTWLRARNGGGSGTSAWGQRPAVAFANFDPCYPIRKRSPKVTRASFRRPVWPHCTRSAPQAPPTRHQNALRLLLPHQSTTPPLPDRPLAHAPLQADDVPDAGARRAGQPAQRLERVVHPPPRVELALVELRLAPSGRHPQDRDRPERVEVRDDEGGLKALSGVVHFRDRAGRVASFQGCPRSGGDTRSGRPDPSRGPPRARALAPCGA
jgi:hypothetical protein